MLHGGMAAREVVTGEALGSRSLALALDQVSRCLDSALPPTGLLAGEFVGEDADDGVNDSLVFHVSLDPHGSQWSDVRRVRFFVDEDDSGVPGLMRGLTNNLLASSTPEENVQVLCRSVGSFQVRYYDGGEWTDSWDSTDRGDVLPKAVRLR